jgi:hypothetical protein
MATVVCWLAQSAGPGVVLAAWPGSNGSVIGTNALEVLGDGPDGAAVAVPVPALALPAALAVAVVPCVAGLPVDELAALQPASTPMPMAATAAMATLRPVVPQLPLLIGCPHRD